MLTFLKLHCEGNYLENIHHIIDPLLNTLGITSSAGEADTASGIIHSMLQGKDHLGHVEGPHHLLSGAADGDSVKPLDLAYLSQMMSHCLIFRILQVSGPSSSPIA